MHPPSSAYGKSQESEKEGTTKKKDKGRKSSTDNIVATRSGRDFSPAIDYASSSGRSRAKELYEKRRSGLVRV